MKVLITGASGRIGGMLAAHLHHEGHHVRGLDIVPPPTPDILDDVVVGGLLNLDTLNSALDDVDAIVHLAAVMSWHPHENQRLFEVNVTGTYQLLSAACSRGISRFVFASSGEVYPELNPQAHPITEAHPTMPNSPYGMTKRLGEEMVRTMCTQASLPYTVLRFAHTQIADELFNPNSFFSGPRFYVNAKIRQFESLPQSPAVTETLERLRAVATEAEQHYISRSEDGTPFRMGMCDARDMCHGIALALTEDAAVNETFNIGPLASFNFDRAVEHLASHTGLPVVNVRLTTTHYNYDTSVEKAVRMLGYRPQYDIFRMIDDAASRVGTGVTDR
ncbi:MAG: NAD(P)-dependent oxidoreductase [Chloroflexota bacterium]